jgi:PPOX class probable F420-dependent enzyme
VILSQDEAKTRFIRSPVAVLGSTDSAGRPHLVPVTYVVLGDRVYIAIDAKPKQSNDLRRLRNIRANPNVSLLADEYDDDWSRLWWVRVDGTAQIGEFGALSAGLLAAFQARYAWYVDSPPTGPVIEIAVAKWTGWAFSSDDAR